MSSYASGTSVPAERSRAELEKILQKYGATSFGYIWEHGPDADRYQQVIAFQVGGRSIRMAIPMPARDDPKFTLTPTRQRRGTAQAQQAYEQEVRRRWRSLVMVIKAKLVAIEDGISTIDREFLSDIVTNDGRTVGDIMRPHLESGGPLALTMER